MCLYVGKGQRQFELFSFIFGILKIKLGIIGYSTDISPGSFIGMLTVVVLKCALLVLTCVFFHLVVQGVCVVLSQLNGIPLYAIYRVNVSGLYV